MNSYTIASIQPANSAFEPFLHPKYSLMKLLMKAAFPNITNIHIESNLFPVEANPELIRW
jgi:hypothetical protein